MFRQVTAWLRRDTSEPQSPYRRRGEPLIEPLPLHHVDAVGVAAAEHHARHYHAHEATDARRQDGQQRARLTPATGRLHLTARRRCGVADAREGAVVGRHLQALA